MSSLRAEALASLESEREYQDDKWANSVSGGKHEIGAYILFMEHHLAKARAHIATGDNDEEAMAEMRKVAALYVAAAEQHGPSFR